MSESSVLAVVTLYHLAPELSPTCLALGKQANSTKVDVVLYDNSEAASGGIPEEWTYIHDPSNGGVAAAYSWALNEALRRGHEWLLLLDQDTSLPPTFLQEVQATISDYAAERRVAAVLPQVKMGTVILSPLLPSRLRTSRMKLDPGEVQERVSAINSGACIRVVTLSALGGFSSEFWLDYLDHWLFWKIHDGGYSVIVSSTCIQHDLSIQRPDGKVGAVRYANFLAAELHFTNKYLSFSWRLALGLRLWVRAIRFLVPGRDVQAFFLTTRVAFRQTIALLGHEQP